MTVWLVILVEIMMGAAILVQLAYLNGLRKSGAGTSTVVKVITYGNISMLVVLGVGLAAWTVQNSGRW